MRNIKLYYKTYNVDGVEYELYNTKEYPDKYQLNKMDKNNCLNGDKTIKEWYGLDISFWENVCSGTLKECEEKLNDIIYESTK